MKVDAVIFDVDGTLWDTTDLVAEAWNRAVADFGITREEPVTDMECYGDTLLSKGENIKLVMERNQIKDAIYVGDTIGDYNASVYAGIPFVYVDYGFGIVKTPDKRISDLIELLELVK